MRKSLLLIVAILVLCTLSHCTLSAAITVHTIGDSTMADYNPSATDKRGWGTYLGLFFNPDFVTVNNRGKSGASTRTFYEQPALWPTVKPQMHAGDYVIIQFAHNDEKSNGLDVLEYNAYLTANGQPALTDLRGTCPNTTYKANLRRFVNEVRELQCTPILVAPICRKYFVNDSTIRRNGQHDLGDKFSRLENGQLLENQKIPADDHSMDYVYQMRQVADEMNVPFIDLTSATRDLYLQYGDAYCTAKLFCQGDKTHTAELGGKLIARLAAQLLKDAGILAEYITVHELSTLHTASADRSRLSRDKNSQLSTNELHSTFNSQLSTSLDSQLSTLASPLSTSMTLNNMRAVDSKAVFTEARGTTVSMQRFHNSDDGKSKTPWPADEIDENAVRYIDFAVTAPADSAIRITSITMDLGASGCTTMSCHINTGFGDGFTDVHTYYEKVGFPDIYPNVPVTPVAITPTHLTIPAGKTLHVRILPWLNGETTPRSGKYICLTNFRIQGYSIPSK